MNLKEKVSKAIKSNKLNPSILGKRNWYNYTIIVSELSWIRNLRDGYKIEFFDKNTEDFIESITI